MRQLKISKQFTNRENKSLDKYLNEILLEHADEISKRDEKEDEETLISIYKNILDENSHKLDLLMG